MFSLAATYSSMDLWMSRWLGARLVTTAMRGLRSMVISWKEDSSSTAQSSFTIPGTSASSGWPIFPPTNTRCPARSISWEMMVVVVVLPSLPVTAMMGQGHTWKNASISEVTTLPLALAWASAGVSGCIPGVRKITS